MAWFHNNRPVHQDCRKVIRTESEEHMHHASLEVRDVQEHDAGSYRVFAINSEGSAESTASLLVAHRGEQKGLPGKAGCMRESWQCLLQQRQEDRLRVVLRCTGSPFDKGQEAEQLSGDFCPTRGMVRTIRFQRLPLVGPHRPGLARGREHSGIVADAEELLDEEIRWKLQRLREAKRAMLKKKQESLMSMPQASPSGKPSPPEAAATTDVSESLRMQVVKGYCKPKAVEQRWQVSRGLLEPCPPLFVQEVKPQEAVEGHRCTFSCLFHGRPQPTVTWYNNAKPVGRIRGTAVHTTECCSTLTFPSVHPQHSGTITCVIFNPLGTVSTSAALYVKKRLQTYIGYMAMKKEEKEEEEEKVKEEKEEEKEKVKKVEEEEVEEEEEVSLAFTAEEELPSTVADSDLLSLPVEIKITAPTPTPEQDTEIKETTRPSSNQTAPIIKHKFKFSFDVGNEPPQIVAEAPAHIHCHEGEAVMLGCAVSGQPPPAVVWALNGQCLSASERLRFEEGKNGIYRLHIQEVSVTDAGLYTCVAKNVAGTAQTASELTVQPSEARLYSKDGGTEKLPSTDHVLHLKGLSPLGNDEEEKITCSKEKEAQLPLSMRQSPSPSEQVEGECEKTPYFRESEMEETVQDIMEVNGRQETSYTEESVRDTDDISEMMQHRRKAVSEAHSFGIDITELHPSMSREEHELVPKDSGHFSEELEAEGDKVVPHIDTPSWDILKSPFMEVKGQTHASEQFVLAMEHEDSQFVIPISPGVHEESGVCMQESDVPAWEAMSTDVPLIEKPSVPQLQDNSASTPTKDQFGFYDLCTEEQQEEQAKEQETSVGIEQDIEVDDHPCKEEMIDARDTTHWDIHNYGQMLQGMESDAGNSSLGLIATPPGIETSGQDFTEEVEVHLEEVQFQEQLLPSETDETNLTFELKKFVEPFPAADTVDTEQAQPPTALESMDVGIETSGQDFTEEVEVHLEEVQFQEQLLPSETDETNLTFELKNFVEPFPAADTVDTEQAQPPTALESMDVGIETSGQDFTEEVEVHLEEVQFQEQLLPSETDETNLTFELKKFVEPFPAADTVDTEQAQPPTALESMDVGIETSGQDFTEEVEVHLEEVQFQEQLLPSETDETNLTFELKKFVEPFPAADTVDTEQAQSPTALESVEVGVTGLIHPVHKYDVHVEETSQSKELCQSYMMQEEDVSAQEEAQPREIRRADLQIPNGDNGSIMIKEGSSAEEINESELSVCREDLLEGQIHSFLVESTADFQRVEETHVRKTEEQLETTDSQSDNFITDLKKAACEQKPQTGHQAEEEESSGLEKIFETGTSISTCETESIDTPEEMLRDTQQEPNTNKSFCFGQLLLGLIMDDPVAQKEQKKESWDKKRTPTEEASDHSLDRGGPGPEPSAVQTSELEPDLPLAKYLRSTGMQKTPDFKGIVQKNQQENITSLEVEEVTFSTVYEYYSNQQELTRPFSPESEMSIELESGSGEESPDSDRFYTPPSSVEIFETASSASYHTPLSTPERYSTPSEGSEYSTPPEHYSTPSEEGSEYIMPPERYSTPSEESSEYSMPPEQYCTSSEEGLAYSMPHERYSTPSEEGLVYRMPHERYSTPFEEGLVYSMPHEHYSTPLESSKCHTPSEHYFTPFEGPCSAAGDSTPPEHYWTPTGEYMDALAMFHLCERRQHHSDQPQAEVFRTPCEALEPSDRQMPPAFLKALSRKRLYEGSTLSFAAEVVGVPKPGVKWYHNKSLLEMDERVRIEKDGDKCVLEIINVQKADGGQYMCHAVNIVGEAKSIAHVEVLSEDGRSLALPPPVTHQHVIHFDLEQNTSSRSPSPQEILLEVELDENEVKEFEKQVKIITSPEFSPDKKSMVVSLDVLPLALLEQAAGLAAENEDIKIDFQVTEMPPRFAVPFSDVKVTEGLEAVFECVVTGTPVPVVQWFRGDICVKPVTGKYVVSQKEGLHSLKIQKVSPSDGGWYHCRAMNRLGEAMCKGSLIVMAQQGASANVSSETITGTERHRSQESDLLLCKTVSPGGQSEIELEFEFGQHRDDSEKAIQLLAVAQQEQEVEGEECVNVSFDVFAEPSQKERVEFRAEDSESCSFEFQVTEAAPTFLKLLSDYSTFLGASACFQCLVTGFPHPTVRWYKDGVLLEGDRYCVQEEEGSSHSLTIENLTQSDSGQYKCVATNRAGMAETCAVLTLY
ncbi:uncharacterized protein PRD47_009205 [Ara ararauna]